MDDVGLPKSSLQKAIKDALPANMRIAGDASELLVQACNQFVHLISTQACSGACLGGVERADRHVVQPRCCCISDRALQCCEGAPLLHPSCT